jgi:hypothetical protein
LSDDSIDFEQTDELDEQDEVEGHIGKLGLTDESDEVEAHIRLD